MKKKLLCVLIIVSTLLTGCLSANSLYSDMKSSNYVVHREYFDEQILTVSYDKDYIKDLVDTIDHIDFDKYSKIDSEELPSGYDCVYFFHVNNNNSDYYISLMVVPDYDATAYSGTLYIVEYTDESGCFFEIEENIAGEVTDSYGNIYPIYGYGTVKNIYSYNITDSEEFNALCDAIETISSNSDYNIENRGE